jgi:hypothetical protein
MEASYPDRHNRRQQKPFSNYWKLAFLCASKETLEEAVGNIFLISRKNHIGKGRVAA